MFGSRARQEREARAAALETQAAEWEGKAAGYAADAHAGRARMRPTTRGVTVTRGSATDADEDARVCEANARDYRRMADNVRNGRMG